MLKEDTFAKPRNTNTSKANILVQKIGEFKDIIEDIDDMIRDYNTDKMLNADKFEDYLSEFNRLYKLILDEIKIILFSLREQ